MYLDTKGMREKSSSKISTLSHWVVDGTTDSNRHQRRKKKEKKKV